MRVYRVAYYLVNWFLMVDNTAVMYSKASFRAPNLLKGFWQY
jgi:hypothetical protein